jgi:hypothetical protein
MRLNFRQQRNLVGFLKITSKIIIPVLFLASFLFFILFFNVKEYQIIACLVFLGLVVFITIELIGFFLARKYIERAIERSSIRKDQYFMENNFIVPDFAQPGHKRYARDNIIYCRKISEERVKTFEKENIQDIAYLDEQKQQTDSIENAKYIEYNVCFKDMLFRFSFKESN